MPETETRVSQDENRGVAFTVLAISFNIVGLGSLAFMNVPVAGGLLIASLICMLFSLYYLTKQFREKKRKA